MRVLLDACVLVPTFLRRVLIGAADAGVFTPLWSLRILDEWARAATRDGWEHEAAPAIADLEARFPGALVTHDPAIEDRLSLPDPDDIHVLAAAIAGEADELLTLNVKDFPNRTLARDGIVLRHPDEFLLEALHGAPVTEGVIRAVYAQAVADGSELTLRAILKRSRLPRVGKEMEKRGAGLS